MEEINKYSFNVYSRDCYHLPEEEIRKAFLKGFENFREAKKYAEKMGENTAIHFNRFLTKKERR